MSEVSEIVETIWFEILYLINEDMEIIKPIYNFKAGDEE